jgi:hypothetical protein
VPDVLSCAGQPARLQIRDGQRDVSVIRVRIVPERQP